MADITENQLLTRWGQLESERATWMPHWRELSAYFLPRNGRYFIEDRDRGQRRDNAIYDNTGTRGLRVLAAGMMSGMTSPARPWFRYGIADQDLAKSENVKAWLNLVTQMTLDVFQKSNTYRTLHAMYGELGAFGTGCSILMEDFANVVHHYPSTVGEFAIASNFKGVVDTLYRKFQKPVGQVVKEFGLDNVTPSTRSMYDSGSLDKWVTVMHAIEPRADRDPSQINARNMAFKSVYWELGSAPGQYLRESGYKRFPVLAPRWDLAGGDIYGNSPGMEALGDTKQLQHQQLRKSQGIDYMTKPPLQMPTSMKGRDVETLPGGITYVDQPGQGGAISTAFNVNLNLQFLLQDIEDVRERIKSAFYEDLFLMLANNTDTQMTATEVAERHEEKLLMLGPVLERLQNELLEPLVDATFSRLLQAGVLPPPPQELHGADLNVEFVSVLAQAQRAVGTNSIDRFVNSLGMIAQMQPQALDKFDSDKWADVYSDMLGIDPELVVPDDKVALIRQQRAKQQQQQQQAEMMQQQADTAQKLGNTPTQGKTALTDIMNAFTGYTTPSGVQQQ